MSAFWLPERICSFDTETTSADPLTARVVTATVLHVGAKGIAHHRDWLINPGVPIPAEATAVHGITDEAASKGAHPLDSIPAIAAELRHAWAAGMPVVIMSAPFDLTVMNEELKRISQEPLVIGPVLDPLVIDRALDPYRKGRRNLTALAAHYGVKCELAHNSMGDALTAARVVWKQARHEKAPPCGIEELQDWQKKKHAEWAGQFELYLRNKGQHETINREWPCR